MSFFFFALLIHNTTSDDVIIAHALPRPFAPHDVDDDARDACERTANA